MLLARLPVADAALPVLGLLRGPLGLAWLALATGVALAPVAGPSLRSAWEPAPRTLFFLAAGLYLAIGQRYAAGLQPSGDEPHYLLMAQSLWREGDLDLRDNLERADYREYTPGPIAPHWGAPRSDGRPFPAHSVGLPVLLAPVYALGGRRLCVALMALAAALLTLEARALALRLTSDRRAALLAWALAAGPPLVFYSFHIYTEVPSALAVLVSLRLLLTAPTSLRAAAAALLAASLPWLHLKMIPCAAALALVALVKVHGRPRLAFFGAAGLAAAAFLAYYHAIYGVASPLALHGGLPEGQWGWPAATALGLLLDRSFGLLPHAPAFLLALAGLPLILAASSLRTRWPYALVALAILAPVLPWRMWWGGQCPPGRFLIPVIPLLAAAAAERLAGEARGLARWRWPLLAWGAFLTLFMTARPAGLLLLNRGDRPTRVWAALSGDVSVARYLPSLVRADAAELRVALLWLVALVLLLGLDGLGRRQERVDRWFSGLALPGLLALSMGAAADHWARKPYFSTSLHRFAETTQTGFSSSAGTQLGIAHGPPHVVHTLARSSRPLAFATKAATSVLRFTANGQ